MNGMPTLERDRAGGALRSAHVPRAGLRPTLLLLLRSAERPTGPIGRRQWHAGANSGRVGTRVVGARWSEVRGGGLRQQPGGHERSRASAALVPAQASACESRSH